jgi:hypothetical protein
MRRQGKVMRWSILNLKSGVWAGYQRVPLRDRLAIFCFVLYFLAAFTRPSI